MAKDRRFVGPFKDNHQIQDAYCDKIAMGLTPAQARKDLELAATTVNEALNPNSPRFCPEFLAKVEEAREEARDRLRQELWTRAVEGTEQELVYKGEKTGDSIVVKSDQILLALGRSLLPEMTDRQVVETRNVNMELGAGQEAIAELPAEGRDILRKLLDMTEKKGGKDEVIVVERQDVEDA